MTCVQRRRCVCRTDHPHHFNALAARAAVRILSWRRFCLKISVRLSTQAGFLNLEDTDVKVAFYPVLPPRLVNCTIEADETGGSRNRARGTLLHSYRRPRLCDTLFLRPPLLVYHRVYTTFRLQSCSVPVSLDEARNGLLLDHFQQDPDVPRGHRDEVVEVSLAHVAVSERRHAHHRLVELPVGQPWGVADRKGSR